MMLGLLLSCINKNIKIQQKFKKCSDNKESSKKDRSCVRFKIKFFKLLCKIKKKKIHNDISKTMFLRFRFKFLLKWSVQHFIINNNKNKKKFSIEPVQKQMYIITKKFNGEISSENFSKAVKSSFHQKVYIYTIYALNWLRE